MYDEDKIRRRLNSDRADERRVGVVMIGKSRNHGMMDALIDVLKHDENDEVRAMAAWSLDLLGSADAVPDLIEAMYDPSFSVRSNAGWALVHLAQRIMPELVLSDVIDVLKDESYFPAREMAYLVLSHIKHDEAQNAIQKYW